MGKKDQSEKFDLRKYVLTVLRRKGRVKRKTLSIMCGCDDPENQRSLDVLLKELEAENRICVVRQWIEYQAETVEVEGIYSPSRRGDGDLVRLDTNEYGIDTVVQLWRSRIFLMPGDRVVVRLSPEYCEPGRPCEGTIVRLIAPSPLPFPAVIHFSVKKGARRASAIPMEMVSPKAFSVSGVPENFTDGNTALVRFVLTESGNREVVYVEDCGPLDAIEAQERLVKMNNGVPGDFPESVLQECRQLPSEPSEADLVGRRDLRDIHFVTIDGDSARDFDDAIAVEQTGPDSWLLRVAIADVSHYVRTGSSLDREALNRGNSWYFPTSVEPMLPRELSNGLCSLNPGVNRLVMWAEIPFDRNGIPGVCHFGCGVIRSFARLTYDGVRDVLLDHREEALSRFRASVQDPDRVLGMLNDAFALYTVLRDARKKRGSLDFDLPETEAEFDASGRVVRLFRSERHDIHRLIEEFMIAANEAVARKLDASGTDFLFRVHPAPDRDKLFTLAMSLKACGLNVKGSADVPVDMRKVLAESEGQPVQFTVNRLCVRSMPQARYSRTNEGHFGLASEYYCHFTSPIRRYADLLVHRALKHALGLDGGAFPVGEKLDRTADILNRQERLAMTCEREMDKRLACLWMARQSGKTRWDGVVSSVMSFGAFVELTDVPVEGLIFVEQLGFGRSQGDWFEYDDRTQMMLGEMTGEVWKVGKRVSVVCTRSDVAALQIDFKPVGTSGSGEKKASKKSTGARNGKAGQKQSHVEKKSEPRKPERRPSLKKKFRPPEKQGLVKKPKKTSRKQKEMSEVEALVKELLGR